jgi:predicted kinase
MSGELIVLIGLPGSGKTEYAKQLIARAGLSPAIRDKIYYRVNWDELRKELGHTGAFDRRREEAMKEISVQNVERAVKIYGYTDVIIDNTNLTASTRNMWRGVAQRLGLTYVEHEMDTDVRLAVQRDEYREGDAQVGRAVIERMALFADRIHFHPSFDIGRKNIVLVDIDGTVADNTHRAGVVAPIACPTCDGTGLLPIYREYRGWGEQKCVTCYGTKVRKKNWYEFYKGVSGDSPKQDVINLVAALRAKGYIICIVSGRPIRFLELEVGKQTVAWLKEAGVRYEHIFMRQSGDKRDDTIVKKEILDKLPKDRIAFVLDDRNSVVKMWRGEGLTCLQVAEGDF